MEELYAAKYNMYWYLSYIAPAVIMILAAFGGRKKIFIVGIIISLVATWWLRGTAVVEKWNIRNEIADTPEEKAYAEADGANLLVEGGFVAPFQAVVSTFIWGFAGWIAWHLVKKLRTNNTPP